MDFTDSDIKLQDAETKDFMITDVNTNQSNLQMREICLHYDSIKEAFE